MKEIISTLFVISFILMGCSMDSFFDGGMPFTLFCFGVMTVCGYFLFCKKGVTTYGYYD